MTAWQALGKAHDALARAVLDTVVFLLGAVVVAVVVAVLAVAAVGWIALHVLILLMAIGATAIDVARLGWKGGRVRD